MCCCKSHLNNSINTVTMSVGSTVLLFAADIGSTLTSAVWAGVLGTSIGDIAASAISLLVANLAKKGKISFKAALIVTAIASAASITASIVALVVLGAPVSLIVVGVLLSALYGITNTLAAFNTYQRAQRIVHHNSDHTNGVKLSDAQEQEVILLPAPSLSTVYNGNPG